MRSGHGGPDVTRFLRPFVLETNTGHETERHSESAGDDDDDGPAGLHKL